MIDHEAMIISQILLTPHIFYETSLNAEMFISYEYSNIYKVIASIIDSGGKPDLISITDKDSTIDKIQLAKISGLAPSSSNWKYYETIIISEWKRRELERLGKRLVGSEETYKQLLDIIEKELANLSYTTGRKEIGRAAEYLPDFLKELKLRYENRGILPGLATGIDGLDHLIQGLRPRLLYVIGGRPSQGKSALGLNIAAFISQNLKKSVGVLSLESSTIELIGRLLSSGANVDGRKIASGFVSSADLDNITNAGERLFNAPLWFWDQPNAKLSDVISMARFMRRQCQTELLILDYLQLVNIPTAVDRRDTVCQTSMAMKQLARELNIPILVLAQLNRDSDNRRPDMGNFQWSSQIEQDADVAIMLYHKMSGDDENQIIDKSFLLVEKCRDGQRGSVPVIFRQEYVKFEDAR